MKEEVYKYGKYEHHRNCRYGPCCDWDNRRFPSGCAQRRFTSKERDGDTDFKFKISIQDDGESGRGDRNDQRHEQTRTRTRTRAINKFYKLTVDRDIIHRLYDRPERSMTGSKTADTKSMSNDYEFIQFRGTVPSIQF